MSRSSDEKVFTVTLVYRGPAYDEADAIAAARAGMLTTEVDAEAVEE